MKTTTKTVQTGYAAKYGILETAMRMENELGALAAERKATERAWQCSKGSERRDFWMKVAQVCADFREQNPEME